MMFTATIAAALWDRVFPEPTTGCWIWTGATNRAGYGNINRTRSDGITWAAHRYFYTKLVGEIPDGMTIDHLCRHPWCVNPDHMEVVSRSENTRREAAVLGRGPDGRMLPGPPRRAVGIPRRPVDRLRLTTVALRAIVASGDHEGAVALAARALAGIGEEVA